MIPSRTLLACLLCLVATAAFPAVGLAQTASQAEYTGVAGENLTSPTTPTGTAPKTPASGTLGATDKGTTPTAKATPAAQIAGETSKGTLPFTGRDLLLMLLAGIGLIGLGVALRSATGHAPAGA